MRPTRMQVLFCLICTCGLLLLIAYYYCVIEHNNFRMKYLAHRTSSKFIPDQFRRSLLMKLKSPKEEVLEELSTIVQSQIADLQNTSEQDCAGVTLLCGHTDSCGFACQCHHRIACLMVSYVLKMPLIHDESRAWPYTKKWSEAFEPLGSSCSVGPRTLRLDWSWNGIPSIKRDCLWNWLCPSEILYPLEHGLPVPTEIGEIVENVHNEPWFWWVGQFTKYALRLSKSQKTILEKQKSSIGYHRSSSPIVGIQIRGTDKLNEVANASYPLGKYLEEAEYYFRVLENTPAHLHPHPLNRTLFIASDSHLILQEVVRRYPPPKWNIFTFPTNITSHSQRERSLELDSIIRDLMLLSECDFVICTFSSNICRLVLEMMSYRFPNPLDRVKSIDTNIAYEYATLSAVIPQKLLKY